MTKEIFENEIKKMISEGECDVDVVGRCHITFKRTTVITLNCFAIFNCNEIEITHETLTLAFYRRGVYVGLVNLKDVKDIYI